MSTLDVACARCDKRFRVRAEFAGKTTRCPGCSAPIVIGSTGPAPPRPRDDPADRPRPRPRPREDDDDRPRRPAGDWQPVATALGREQAAALFVIVSLVSSFVVVAVGAVASAFGPPDPFVMVFMGLLLIGPALTAGVFGLTARAAALRAPPESLARGSAAASLLCALGGLASLLLFGLAFLASIESHRGEPVAFAVAAGGVIASTLGAVATFVPFVAQVGIARRSEDVGRAFGRVSVGLCVCLLALLGISFLYALGSALSGPSVSGRSDEPTFAHVMFGFLVPAAVAVMLVLYHRLLAAARQAVQAEPAGRYDG